MARIKLLVVDDYGHMLTILQHILVHAGYDVDVALDAESALKLAALHQPSQVILDYYLPQPGSGWLMKRLRHELGIPCAYVTACDDAKAIQAMLLSGALGVVQKVDLDEVLPGLVGSWLEESETRVRPRCYRIGNIYVDLDCDKACRAGKPLFISRKGLILLAALADRHGRSIDVGEIQDLDGPDGSMTPEALMTLTCRVRHVVGHEETWRIKSNIEGRCGLTFLDVDVYAGRWKGPCFCDREFRAPAPPEGIIQEPKVVRESVPPASK